MAEELTDRRVRTTAGAVVTGYAGGIDSFCTICDHLPGVAPDDYRLTHLLINNSGSYGRGQEGRRMFRERLARLGARTPLGLPLIAVDSNLDEIIGTHYQLTHTIRNLIFALLLQSWWGNISTPRDGASPPAAPSPAATSRQAIR